MNGSDRSSCGLGVDMTYPKFPFSLKIYKHILNVVHVYIHAWILFFIVILKYEVAQWQG